MPCYLKNILEKILELWYSGEDEHDDTGQQEHGADDDQELRRTYQMA